MADDRDDVELYVVGSEAELRRRALAELADPVAARWWCSFADPDAFLGVAIVNAAGPVTAVRRCHELGINPGGSVMVVAVALDTPNDVCDRLLTRDEVDALNASVVQVPVEEDDGV